MNKAKHPFYKTFIITVSRITLCCEILGVCRSMASRRQAAMYSFFSAAPGGRGADEDTVY